MEKKVLKRTQVNEQETWDLTRLFKTEKAYEEALEKVQKDVDIFVSTYQDNLKKDNLKNSLNEYQKISVELSYLGQYASLHSSVDQVNPLNMERQGRLGLKFADLNLKLAFYFSEIEAMEDQVLEMVILEAPEYEVLLKRIIKDKKHAIPKDIKKALTSFSQVLESSYPIYENFKHGDMDFKTFKVEDKDYPMSFTMFENDYAYDANHLVRRAAYEHFYEVLKTYENGLATNYQTHVLKEKAYASLKGFDSVIDYLLYDQEVTREMYDRQLDVMMEKLSKVMRKYARHIQEVYQLERLTYADLLLSLDPAYEPKVSIVESKAYVQEALSILGPNYRELVDQAFRERWIDFPQNLGKTTGGFCASPYQRGSYILLNWNYQMSEVFVLAHELGHAGHFHYAGQSQNYYMTDTSLYFIEAPSTMNELLMAEHLKKTSDDPRFKRFVLTNMIARTYYHNCVTHFLEAYFQREVYRYVDSQKPLSAPVLNQLKLDTLKKFWQEDVKIDDYAGRTWMRQPHYFMGLYPYTYSAGLTIATSAYKKIIQGKLDVERWIDVLRAGGTKTPLELASMVGVDLKVEKPLLDMIQTIDQMIDEIIILTKEINK